MGEKISTVVLKVDLECKRCYKKVRKALCKIQDKMEIKTISYDEKSNSVTISGPFDPDKVCRKLCCQAGSVIKEMNIKGKDGDKPAAKPAEKDAGKPEKAKDEKAADKGGKAEKEVKKAEKDGKADKPPAEEKKEAKAETKDAKPAADKPKDGGKAEKHVTFKEDDPKAAKAIPKADLGPLLEKIMAAKAAAGAAGPEPPRGEPVAPPPAAQGIAVPSIWPAPASSLAGYSYNPSYDPSYYGGGGGYYAGGYDNQGWYYGGGKPTPPTGGYYGVPVYDNQGWYYGGGRQPYYPQQQQQSCCEDPNAGCSVM